MAAQIIKTNVPGLTVTKNDDGIWLTFESKKDGKSASISMDDIAHENIGGIIGQAIKSWCDEVSLAIAQGIISEVKNNDY